MKRTVCVAMAFVLCLCLFAIPALAAPASATFTGPGTVRAGDTITLTFNVNGTNVLGVQGSLSYDSSVLELKSTSAKIGGDWVVEFGESEFVVYDNNQNTPLNKNTALFAVTFKVKSNVAVGTAIKVSCNGVLVSDGKNESNLGAITYSATIAPPMSTDNSLKSLTVSNATISPAFSSGTTNYTAEVPFEVSKLQVSATANDSKATVSVNSPNLVPGGTTKVTVTVKAENGSTKTYTITVKRAQDPNYQASGNNNLSGISVNGFLLSPVFSADNTQYVIWLPYETDSVTVSGTCADGKASVRVEGGSNLVAGADNEIKVICTAENGTEKVYTIVAKRAAAHGSAPTEPTNPTNPTEPTEPSEPVQPTQPQASEPKGEGAEPVVVVEGMPWWLLIVGAGAGLVAGLLIGIIIKKKK